MRNADRREALNIAVEMVKREHDRWAQWALFYFGAIASVFVLWNQLKNDVNLPLYVPSFIAALISAAWVFAALGIRATTDTWFAAAKHFESAMTGIGGHTGAFAFFDSQIKLVDKKADFIKVLKIWKKERFFSVTRALILFGLLSFLAFLGLGLYDLYVRHQDVGCIIQKGTDL